MTNAIKNSNRESFADYLRRVGDDYADSGSDATAQDYRDAAAKIDAMTLALQHAHTSMSACANGNPVLKHSITVVKLALKEVA